MKMELNSHYINEVLSLSKADNVSFINKDNTTYIVAHDQNDVTFKNQIVRKLCGVGDSGKTLINKDVLKLIPKDTPVTITEDTIIAGKRKIKYTPNSLVDGPIEINNLLTTIPAGELKHLLSCDYAMAKTEVRPVLNGVCINNGEFVSSDGYRLAIRKGNFKAKEQVIIAADVISILKKVRCDCEVKIYYDDNYIKFQFGDLEIISYRQLGEYFKYKSVIPEDYTTSITLETKPILDILKDYKKNKFEIVKLNFKENELIISSNNETATVEESININLQGKPLEIAFNINYLIDAFKNYDNATLELIFTSPIVVKENNKLDLVLPVRMVREN